MKKPSSYLEQAWAIIGLQLIKNGNYISNYAKDFIQESESYMPDVIEKLKEREDTKILSDGVTFLGFDYKPFIFENKAYMEELLEASGLSNTSESIMHNTSTIENLKFSLTVLRDAAKYGYDGTTQREFYYAKKDINQLKLFREILNMRTAGNHESVYKLCRTLDYVAENTARPEMFEMLSKVINDEQFKSVIQFSDEYEHQVNEDSIIDWIKDFLDKDILKDLSPYETDGENISIGFSTDTLKIVKDLASSPTVYLETKWGPYTLPFIRYNDKLYAVDELESILKDCVVYISYDAVFTEGRHYYNENVTVDTSLSQVIDFDEFSSHMDLGLDNMYLTKGYEHRGEERYV